MTEKGARLSNVFIEKIAKYKKELKNEDKLFRNIGYIKIILVIMLGVALYYEIVNQFEVLFRVVLAAIFLILVLFWIYHIKIKDKIDYLKRLIALNEKQLHRIEGKWTDFEDLGLEFVDMEHPYGCDLDIVGKGSLFQFLNATETWHGRQAFSNDLLSPKYSTSQIYKRQEAVKELSNKIDFSNGILFHLGKIGLDPTTPDLNESLKDDTPFLRSTSLRIFLKGIPLITLSFIGINLVFSSNTLLILLAFFAGLQVLAWIMGFLKTPNYLKVMASLPYKIGIYTTVIEHLVNEKFSSDELVEISEQLKNAGKGVKELSKIASRISIKHNPFLYFFLNIALLWDYQSAFALERWKQKYSISSEEWFLAVGKVESLLSLSHLSQVCVGVSLPTFNESERTIFAKELGHPLLLNEKRVTNDFDFQENIVIISGSNMSGKTTFLRTVGINLVLAKAGGFVCAKEMNSSLLNVITSMRVTDDLSEGISTFYAELKRIKGIIDSTEDQPNLLFLIDEIFRGTNSKDRLLGAKTVINKLRSLKAVGLISTHDLELCQLADINDERQVEVFPISDSVEDNEKGTSIKNNHFSEYYKDNRIYFDYQLKEGSSTTSNARFLMEMVGISIEK